MFNLKLLKMEISNYIISAKDILELEESRSQFLLEGFLPKIGVALLVGVPDSAKSQLSRQLCISLIGNDQDFLGFQINREFGKALFIATEDDRFSIKKMFELQIEGKEINSDNLHFCFREDLNSDQLVTMIDAHIQANPLDLVVCDTWGDISDSIDANDNSAVRKLLNQFDAVAKKRNCLFLFVHHLNKKGSDQAPNQKHVQGAGALNQKSRATIALNKGSGKTIYLSILKANSLPSELKDLSMVLEFNEENLSFINTGEKADSDTVSKAFTERKNDAKLKSYKQTIDLVFADDSLLKYSYLVSKIMASARIGNSTAKRWISDMLSNCMLTKTGEGYSKVA